MKHRLSEQQLRQQVRYFGYYQVIAGILAIVFGLVTMMVAAVQPQAGRILGVITLLFGTYLTLCIFEIYCGYLTLKQPQRGLKLSRISLLLQFIGFAAGGYGVKFFVGLYAEATVNLSNDFGVSVSAGLGNSSFAVNSSSDELFFSINLVAMLLFMRTTQWLNEWDYRYTSGASSATAMLAAGHDAHA
jgi:Ca2+/Na+ antiporter